MAYPIIVYFGLRCFDVRNIAIALIIFALIRLLQIRRQEFLSSGTPQAYLVVGALLVVGISALASNSPILLQYYPVCLSGFMLALFSYSLFRPPSVIEQIARIKESNFPDSAISYTRKVTIVWCGFFVINGAIALLTVLYASVEIWALYNGFISYLLIGMLIAGEYIVRRRVRGSPSPSHRIS